MRVITEIELREAYKQQEFTSYNLPADCRLTPAAAQFLSERRIVVNQEGAATVQAPEKPQEKTYSLKSFGGTKPEYLTHIQGSALVEKNHPRIKFRGKLDSFEAMIISAIVEAEADGYRSLGADLREVLRYVREILRAEVKEEPLEPISFNGWSAQEIRERSHYPEKFFGTGHLLPNPEQGRVMAQLNFLRTQVREMELAALDAFGGCGEKPKREDIIQAINRLSSLIYIFMVGLASGHYRPGL